MIGWAGQWTQTPSTTPLQPKQWNAHFWITFNFWWSARQVNGLKPHPPPLSSQKNEMLIFWLCSTSDDQLGWSMDLNPIHHPSAANKMKCFFLDYVHFWWSARLIDGLKPHAATPLQPKKWNAHFCITFNSWCWPDWSMTQTASTTCLQPIKWNPWFLYYVELLMISQAGWWTRTLSANPLQPKKWNAHFWILFNFWWSARLVNGLKPHLPPLSSQKNEMLIFGLCSTSDDQQGWSMDSNPICHPSPAKKLKCSFLYYVQLLMIGQAGQWTRTPSTTPLQPKNEILIFGLRSTSDDQPRWSMDSNPILHLLSSQRNEMLIFVLCSTSNDQLGWSMNSNPICQPSPANKMKCSFLDYIQLLIISRACQWTWTPSTTCLQPKKWNAHILIMFNFWCWPDWSMDSNPIHHPSPAKKWNVLFGLCSTSDDQPGWLMDSNPAHLHPSPANKMKCSFWIMFTSDDLPGWLMNLNLICHPSPPIKMKCSIFNYVQLLMISQAGQLTQSPSASPLQPIKWNASFWIMFTSDDQPGWLMDSNPICHPSPAKKMKCSLFDYVHFGWSAGLVDGLKPHPSPLSSQ